MIAPESEQMICIRCGMCCDGTLFLNAHLDKEEIGQLPLKIEENTYSKDGKYFFRLPCSYFSDRCSIYHEKKANVCSMYRCQLLRDFSQGKFSFEEALEIVREALKMRSLILKQYNGFLHKKHKTFFKQILRELGKIDKLISDDKSALKKYNQMLVNCNIFEALLIKYFNSAEEFNKMIMR